MDKLHELAAAIVAELDEELFVVQSDENSYEYAESTIRLNLRDDDDYGFMRHLREVHGYDNSAISPMLWTILHEVGHSETDEDYTEKEYIDGINTKACLACCSDEEMRTNEVLQDRYFNTVEEWLATEWAIDYVKSHLRKCKKWSHELEALK